MSNVSQGRSALVQGRIVWVSGDLFKGRVKLDPNTRQPKLNAQGEPINEYGLGLAVPKEMFQQHMLGQGQPGEIWTAMMEEARAIYPQGNIPPTFAWKYKDGDGIDDKGMPFANRPGYKGCLVFALTTTIPIKFFRWQDGIGNVMVNDGIKCGDYVNVQVHVKGHPAIGQGKPGLYLNPNLVQLVRVGEAIINAPDANTVFGNAAPAGMDYNGPAAPAMPSMQVPAAAPSNPTGYPQAPVQPHYNILPPQHQPAMGNLNAPAAPMSPMGASVPGVPAAPAAAPSNPTGYPQAPVHGLPPTGAAPGAPQMPHVPGMSGFPGQGQ